MRPLAASVRLFLAAVVLASACGQASGGTCLIMYTRNLSETELFWELWWPETPAIFGTVSPGIFATGAKDVAPGWELLIGPPGEGPEPLATFQKREADFSAADPLIVWVSVAPDGRTVNLGEGMPAWWDADIQQCG